MHEPRTQEELFSVGANVTGLTSIQSPMVEFALRAFFPVSPITRLGSKSSSIQAWRADDEFEVAGIFGLGWPDISVEQARATVDVLWYLDNERYSLVLPGYIQFIGDPRAADAMAEELAAILLRRSQASRSSPSEPIALTPEQRALVGLLFSAFALIQDYASTETDLLFREVAEVYLTQLAEPKHFGVCDPVN